MAVNEIIVKGLVEIEVSGKSGAEAVAAMKKLVAEAEKVEKATKGVGDESTKASQGVNAFSKSISGIGAAITGALAAGVLINFLRDSYLGFAKLERNALSTENQIRSLGQATEGAGFREFIRNLSQTSGILSAELIPAFQRAIGAFKDYKTAEDLVTLASKFAAAGIGDVSSNLESIARFFQTGRADGLVKFGVDLRAGASGTIDLSEGLSALNERALQVGGSFNDAQRRVETFGKIVDDAKNSVGQLTAIMLDSAEKAATSFFASIPTNLLGRFGSIGEAVKFVRDNAEAIEQARIDAFFNAESELEAANRLFANRQGQLDEQENAKRTAAALKAEENRLKRVAELEQSAGEQLLQQQVANTIAGTDERIKLELELNERVAKFTLEKYAKTGASTVELEKFFQGERERIKNQKSAEVDAQLLGPGTQAGLLEFQEQARKHQEALTQILEEGLLGRLEITRDLSPEGSQQRIDAEADLQRAQIEVRANQRIRAAQGVADTIEAIELSSAIKTTAVEVWQTQQSELNAQRRLSIALGAAAGLAGALSGLFNNNKAFAIAQAVVNTALGITEVWTSKSTTGNIIADMALKVAATATVAASGAAQIAAIRSATIGGGGGGSSPSVASAPTQQASNPNPPSQVAAQSQATIDALAGRSSSVLGSGTVINIGTAFGDRQAMTKLAREINRVNANNQSVLR